MQPFNPGKAQSTKSMFVSVFDVAKKERKDYLMPNFNQSIRTDKQTTIMVLHIDGIDGLETGKEYTIVTLCTNDPCTRDACGGVSLGYYRFRMDFRQCMCVNVSPPTFEGWSRLQRREFLADMRE